MGLFDEVKRQFGNSIQGYLTGSSNEGESGQPSAMADHFAGLVEQLGLGGILQKLREGGLEETVSSWIGKGSNLPISAEQVRQALGSDTVQNLAAKVGIPPEQIASLLAQILPHTVDRMTPEGQLDETAGSATEIETETP